MGGRSPQETERHQARPYTISYQALWDILTTCVKMSYDCVIRINDEVMFDMTIGKTNNHNQLNNYGVCYSFSSP